MLDMVDIAVAILDMLGILDRSYIMDIEGIINMMNLVLIMYSTWWALCT